MNAADYLIRFWHNWVIDLAVLLVLFLVILINWKRFMKFSVSNMIRIAVVIWLGGVVVYAFGFAYGGTGHSLASTFFRASIASIKMFIADNEFNDISPYYKDEPIYMAAFAIVHFLAVCLVAILILNTLGKRARSYAILLKEMATCRRKPRHSYVFWDVNTPSISLAADIRKNEKDARIIFLCPFSPNSIGQKLDITQILSAAQMSSELTSSWMDETSSVLVIHMPDAFNQGKRFKWLEKILKASTAVDFFFLTDDPDTNLMLAESISKRNRIQPRNNGAVGIHVLTQGSSRQKVTEEHLLLHGNGNSNVQWSFVDIPSIAVESLKYNIGNYPVSTFADGAIVDGRVDGKFNSWILGLGDTGKEIFRFLYEFSALEGKNADVIDRSIVLFDNDAERLAGDLLKGSPEVLQTGIVKASGIKVGSKEFWDRLKDEADTLNCISIALGDDEFDLKMARDVYRHLRHFSEAPKVRTKIFVRVYTPEYIDVFRTLADEYRSSNLEIVPFGGERDLFITAIILKDEVMRAFKAFNYCFDKVRGKDGGLSAEECWEKDFNIAKYTAEYEDVTVALDELERRKAQCMSSTFFTNTLLKLAGIAGGDVEKIDALLGELETADGNSESLADVLIRTAYLRERASHRLLGFTACSNEEAKADRIASMTHKKTPYLLPWKESTDASKKLFRDILRTSLQVAKEYSQHNYGK